MSNDTLVVVISSHAGRRKRIVEAVRSALDPAEVVELETGSPSTAVSSAPGPAIELIDAEAAWLAVERHREHPTLRQHSCAVVSERDTLFARRLTAEPVGADGWVPLPNLLQTFRDEMSNVDRQSAPRPAPSPSTEFLSRMSHELRTPLNAILGFAQLLEMDELSPEQEESVDHIVTAGRHLLALVDETLDISRIETGRMHLSLVPVVAADAIQQTLERLRREAEAAGVKVTCADDDATVLADRDRFQQILFHVLKNAIAYNRPGGTVVVDFESPSPRRTRILVHDTGPGIPPERLPRLFEPFDRLGAEQGKVRGVGLGLTLVKRLLDAMGGEIGVESEVGVGSTFWVELSNSRRQNGPGPEPRPSPLGSAQLGRVLCVEDNPDNFLLIQRLLESLPGTELIHATTAAEANDLAASKRPDLVLLDLNLPDARGEEVLQHLRKDAATRTVPVIAISADASPERRNRVLGLGVVAYLTKPLDVSHFSEAIEACNRDRRGTR